MSPPPRPHVSTSTRPHGHTSARRHRSTSLTALVILTLMTACDALPGKPTAAERPLRPAEVVDFDQLYGDNCAGCHGSDGQHGGARPLNDPLYLAWLGQPALARIAAAGVPDSLMPGFATSAGGMLTEVQIEVLANGIYARWARPEQTRAVAIPSGVGSAPGDARRGADAYATYCARCHGADGSGGTNGGSVVDGSYLGLVSEPALRSAVIFGRPDLGMPDWRSYAAGRAMADQEIADVVAWLVSQRPRFPGQPYARN